jgi:hypothetical protein
MTATYGKLPLPAVAVQQVVFLISLAFTFPR